MKETTIALEQTGLSLADWVARARREHTTFVVLEAAVPVARLVPAPVPSCTGAELARALATTELSPEEARTWADDLRQARAALNTLKTNGDNSRYGCNNPGREGRVQPAKLAHAPCGR